MNRRELLQCAAMLCAGATKSPLLLASISEEQREMLSTQASYIDRKSVSFFSTLQRKAITSASDRIIPRTDTPGAIDAGVPRFIELMVSDWLTKTERRRFVLGLQELIEKSDGDFSSLGEGKQLELLEELEELSADSDWYGFSNTLRIWNEEAPFICQLKELTVLGFLLSETGSHQFLQINPMGLFDGSYRLNDDYSAYDKHTLIRLLSRETS